MSWLKTIKLQRNFYARTSKNVLSQGDKSTNLQEFFCQKWTQKRTNSRNLHHVTSVQIQTFFWSKFIQSKYRIIRTKEDSVFGRFSSNITFAVSYYHMEHQTVVTDQKTKFFIRDFISKSDQICKWSHLLKKSLTENFYFFGQCV